MPGAKSHRFPWCSGATRSLIIPGCGSEETAQISRAQNKYRYRKVKLPRVWNCTYQEAVYTPSELVLILHHRLIWSWKVT